MHRLFTNFLFFLIICFFSSCDFGDRSQIPIESFFNQPKRTNFQLSPNGKFISFVQKYNGVENLYVMDLAADKIERITSETDIGIRSSFWANNDEIIFMKHRQPGDSLRLMAVNKDALSVRYILPPEDIKLRWVGPMRVNKDNELLVSLNSRDSSVFDVYRIHIINCTLEMIAENPGNISEWLPDNDGKIRVAVASDGHTETILYRQDEHSSFIPIIENNFRTSVKPLGLSSQKENRIYALSNVGRDKKALVSIDLLSGKEDSILFTHPDMDVSEGGYSVRKGAMDFVTYNAWKPEHHFFNTNIERVYSELSSRLDNYAIEITGKDDDFSKFLVRAYTDIDPGAFYFYDSEKQELKELGKVNEVIKPKDLSPTHSLTYTAKDGTEIHAYLTLPKGSRKMNLPTIVLPHNGPSSRVVWGYNAEVQFLVSRGFAVFQPNYRGSTGYGKAFWISGFKEWGKKIQQDIRDGVEWLVSEGIANPAKIGIYGSNFGGYSALHGACFNSDIYSCAASYSGITNLYTYLKEMPSYYSPYMKRFYEMVGDPKTDGDYLREFSPVFHPDKVKIPLFIAQGGKDTRNNVNETNIFVKELRKNGVDVTYMLKEEEGNGFQDYKNKLDFYLTLAGFFEKHLLKH